MEILPNLFLKWIRVPCGCMTCGAVSYISVTELQKCFSYLFTKPGIFLKNLLVLPVKEKRIQSDMDIKDSCVFSAKFGEHV